MTLGRRIGSCSGSDTDGSIKRIGGPRPKTTRAKALVMIYVIYAYLNNSYHFIRVYPNNFKAQQPAQVDKKSTSLVVSS